MKQMLELFIEEARPMLAEMEELFLTLTPGSNPAPELMEWKA